MNTFRGCVLACLFAYAFTVNAFAWSSAHPTITQAAFNTLPQAQRAVWGAEAADPIAGKTRPISEGLIQDFCYYPDKYDCGPKNPTFRPQVKPFIYFEGATSYHYFTMPQAAAAALAERGAKWYVERITDALRAGKTMDAAQYAGAWAHAIEDRVSPYHCLDGFEPHRAAYEAEFHVTFAFWALEDKGVKLSLGDYKPRLLGVNATEAAEKFTARFIEINQHARDCMRAYIAAHLKDDHVNRKSGPDTNAVMVQMAEPAAKLIADTWYTCFLIASDNARQADVAD